LADDEVVVDDEDGDLLCQASPPARRAGRANPIRAEKTRLSIALAITRDLPSGCDMPVTEPPLGVGAHRAAYEECRRPEYELRTMTAVDASGYSPRSAAL